MMGYLCQECKKLGGVGGGGVSNFVLASLGFGANTPAGRTPVVCSAYP